MNIIVSEHAGFCFGVKNAVKKALEEAEKQKKPIHTLGQLIHNNTTIKDLENRGIYAVNRLDELKPGDTVIIRAHGIPEKTEAELKEKQIHIIDATCPFVKKIHRLAVENYNKGRKIVIIGDANHPEVIGINGWCGDSAVIINSLEDAQNVKESLNNAVVVVQTTYNVNLYKEIKNYLNKTYENIDFYDTICNTTIVRQENARKIASNADMMLVIGSHHSANSQQLFNICKGECVHTYLVEFADDIPHDIINENIKNIGITAGASTPDKVIKEVIGRMEELNKQGIETVEAASVVDTPESKESGEKNFFEEALEDSLVTVRTGQVVKGRIISYNTQAQEVYVDLGFKIDGTIPFSEYTDDSDFDPEKDIKEGQEIEVLVVRVNESEGNVLLSKKKVDNKRKWKLIENAHKKQEVVTVKVKEVIKGGLLAVYEGQEVFIPASQVSDRFIRNLNKYVNNDLDIRIIELNKRRKKVVGSSRVLIEEEKARVEKEVWDNIEVGKVYNGIVKSITDFGVFVDIGGIDGLVHISELSWSKINHPSEVVKKGQAMEVFVLDFDREANRISLGYRKEEDNPWYNAEQKYAVGTIVEGKVVRIVPFGAFIEIAEGVDGLVHISQISTVRINKVEDVLTVGMNVKAKIIENDVENKKISLSIKEVSPIEPPYAQEIINDNIDFAGDEANYKTDRAEKFEKSEKVEKTDKSDKFDRFERAERNIRAAANKPKDYKKMIDEESTEYKREFKKPARERKDFKDMPEAVLEHKEELENKIGDLLQGLNLSFVTADEEENKN
jgi:small subunit ribosomal protein S1